MNERANVIGQSGLQLLTAGSYAYVEAEAHGSAMNGLPPPQMKNLPKVVPLPGTFVGWGMGASPVRVFVAIW
jgi:hypothetical protein